MPDILKLQELCTKTVAHQENMHRFLKKWYDSGRKNLHGGSELYDTIVSPVFSETESKCHSLKSFQNHLIANCFEPLQVYKVSDNNCLLLVVHPVVVLLRFCVEVSPAFVEIQDISKSGRSNAIIVLGKFEEIKSNFQRECKKVVPRSTLPVGKNGMFRTHISSSKSKYHKVKKHILLSENPEKPSSTQSEVYIMHKVISLLTPCHQNSSADRECQTTSVAYFQQCSQTEKDFGIGSKGTQTSSQLYKDMETEILNLKGVVRSLECKLNKSEEQLERAKRDHKEAVSELMKKNDVSNNKIITLESELKRVQEELKETFLELGRVSVENARIVNQKKREIKFNKTFKSKPQDLATIHNSETSISTPTSSCENNKASVESVDKEKFGLNGEITEEDSAIVVASVQETGEESSGGEGIKISNIPTNAVERSLYNNYRLLLYTIVDRLLPSEKTKFKEWAGNMFSVDVTLDISEVLFELDRKGVIGAQNLQRLSEFFEKNLRIDLVHLIDCFLVGDYSHLRTNLAANVDRFPRNVLRITNSGDRFVASRQGTRGSSAKAPAAIPLSDKTLKRSFTNTSEGFEIEESFINPQPELQNSVVKTRCPDSGCETEDTKIVTPSATSKQVGTDGVSDLQSEVHINTTPVNMTSGKTVSSKLSGDVSGQVLRAQGKMGSNGNKLSKFQRALPLRNNSTSPQDSNDGLDDWNNWLCHHYKRRCYVKFSCCNKYWPCHRCHNNESKCGKKKLKSRDTKFVKCVNCGTQQPFSERSQFCTKCSMKFCKYFCPTCKHLTGMDDNPYHCGKCGICRIHSDRSFHCDICGVCLDRQLLGNHKCRAGSAHDECCICLEDAFSGCQILPCSHKVHKECATQMIRSGITRCPICRESFAHKLERRYLPSSKKQQGNP